MEKKIIQAFRNIVALHGRIPTSLLEVAQAAGMPEPELLAHVSSIQGLIERSWKHDFATLLEQLDQDPAYAGYGARERVLAFYYTWIEILKQNRSFYQELLTGRHGNLVAYTSARMLRADFLQYIRRVIEDGKSTGEIEDRMLVSKAYAVSLWPHFLYVLAVWVKDHSDGFSHTDAAIEKSVNLGFDALGRNLFDSAADFVKFNLLAVFPGK